MPRILGSVPYLNAKPLLHAIPAGFEVRLAPPAELAGRFAAGEFEAALLPIIDAFRTPGAMIVPPHCIAARRDVLSVRLFLDRPLAECRTLARDPASHTSNALLEILARLKWKRPLPPPPPGATADGRLLIGDAALRALGSAAFEIDLAGEWIAWTGLPFVFAAWITQTPKPGLTPALAASAQAGLARRDATADAEAASLGLDRALCRRYLQDAVAFDLDADAVRGAELFWRHAASIDLAPAARPLPLHLA
ncbi:MAG: menaquinone biosynthesis protein [Planctomycetes bacterium]|nr:menaquinone biosynthesis protein [Planctomycetota bacterium]